MQVGVMIASSNHADWERLLANDYSRPPETPDAEMVDNAIRLGDLVEPLGFNSLWTTEHYGSAYSMQPNPLQFLAYWAGRTKKIDLGSAVVVVPWWNPVRLASEISMLDLLLGGRRLLLGLGRGISEHEYKSFGVPREQSRDYFYEIYEILQLALSQERFEYDGKIFEIPPTSIRPQARHKGDLLGNVRAAFSTQRSAELAAEAGLGQLFVAGEPLDQMRESVIKFNGIRASRGLPPDQPTALLWMYCARDEADVAKGRAYYQAQRQATLNHYFKWNTSGFEVPGYEEYAEKLNSGGAIADIGGALNLSNTEMLIGTPEQILENIHALQEALSMDYLVLHVSYGDMPVGEAERSMRLFAEEVLPHVQRMPTPFHPASVSS
jgi:alkanesulfonate monooxygenase SsuD/methylene tetrahydromethanopterin reductase-like flavin-dependent oxidoreductase (luciferase family)